MISINDNHEYCLNGERVPSVTQIISEILGIVWVCAEWYLDRGKAIHACAALIAEGKEFKFDDRISGYVAAIRKFFDDVKPELPYGYGEKMVVSNLFKYAGTIDLPCKISGKKVIVDYKSGSIDDERLRLQCGGYSQGFDETVGEPINFGCGVKLNDNGTYSMTELFPLRTPRNEFLSLRTAYKIKERIGKLNIKKEVF